MQTFFWPSVIAVYIGFAILLLDIALERFAIWIRLSTVAVIVALCWLFTHAVVLRKSEIFVVHKIVNQRLRVTISNESEDDYQNLDLKIRPEFPKTYVSDPKEIGNQPGVSFIDPMPFISSSLNESISATFDTTKPELGVDYRTNFLRFRCDSLPSHSAITVEFSLSRSAGREMIPVYSASTVEVDGKLKGRFRMYDVRVQSQGIYF